MFCGEQNKLGLGNTMSSMGKAGPLLPSWMGTLRFGEMKSRPRFLRKLKREPPSDPAISLPGSQPKTMTSGSRRDKRTPTFSAALLRTAKTQRRLRVVQWMSGSGRCGVFFSHMKKAVPPFVTTQTDLEDTLLSEASQSDKHCMVSLMFSVVR